MIIAYDLRYACDHFVGIGTYAFALLEALLALPGDERYVVLWDPRQAQARYDLEGLRAHPRVTWVERPYAPLGSWALVQAGAWLRRLAPGVYFSPFHLLPLAPGCPCVLTVHDVRPLRFRGELGPLRRTMFHQSLRRACRAQRLVTVSEFSRAEILALLPAAPARVRVIRPGVQPGLGALTGARPSGVPDRPFALVVGDNRPHKNQALLADAWARLGATAPLALVGAGPVDARHPDLVTLARRRGVAAHHLGRVSQAGLAWLYRNATLFLFPSGYEGFGSPLAEALAYGLPAVASDLPVLREFGDDAACFVAPDRPDLWARAVTDLAGDAAARARLGQAGRARAAALTYEGTARGVLAVLAGTARGGAAMKVVHVYKDYYPPVFGGIETTLSRMARGAAAAGHEVTVLCSANRGRRTTEEVREGVRIIRCAEWLRLLSTPLCPSMPFRLAGLDADLCHLHFPYPVGELSWLLTQRNRPLLVTYHSDIIRQAFLLPLVAPLIDSVLSRARFVMPTSPQYIERSPFLRRHRARCRVLAHGIDQERFEGIERLDEASRRLRERYGTPLVLFVGRFRHYKGLPVLFEAMRRVNGRLVLVGGGKMEQELRALQARLGLGEKVHFAGSVDDEAVLAHYHAADVFVLPSINPAEAYGLSMIEAMSSGTPVICTELGTGTSFVNRDGETGLVVPPADPGALAGAINRLLEDPAEARRMGEAGRRRARSEFSTGHMVHDLLEIYAEAVR